MTYVDVLATGPKGQKTVDHTVLAALRAKEGVGGVDDRAVAITTKRRGRIKVIDNVLQSIVRLRL